MKTQWHHILALSIAIAVAVIFLYLVRDILPPFLIAFTIAWLLDPVLDRLQQRGCHRILAVIGVYAIFLAIFVLGLLYLVPAVAEQAHQLARDLPTYSEQFKAFGSDLLEQHRSTLAKFKLPTTLEEALARYGHQATKGITSGVQHAGEIISANLSKALWLILIPLIAFYFLNDIDRIRKKAVLFIPEQWRPKVVEILTRMGGVFSSYVRGLVIVCLLYGLSTTAVLAAFKLEYGIILGLLAGVLYAVPYMGAILITLLVFLVGLASHGFGPALWMALAMMGLNQIFDMAITPKVLGKSVGLHPVLSLFAMLAGGHLFGLMGMVLAVPVAASIAEVVYEFYPELRPLPEKKQKRINSKSKVRSTKQRANPKKEMP